MFVHAQTFPPVRKPFEPVEVKITFDTEEEFLAFHALMKTNLSVPMAVSRCYDVTADAVRNVIDRIEAQIGPIARGE
jgi:hypothetical protein